jgi:DNA-binding NarL/FixJ family response regulator
MTAIMTADRPRKTPGGEHGLLRVVVVDDHPIVRKGLVDLFGDERDMTVCGQAGTVADAMAVVASTRPDVVLVDLSLGSESGLDLVAGLAKAYPAVRTLVLSGHDERLYAERALRAGALGYIMKDESASGLLAAVRRVGAGKSYVSEVAADRILSTMGRSRRPAPGQSPLERLSDRERHVLTLIGQGLATREIAERLKLSVKTVETHYAHIKEKLGARTARELTRVAVSLAES